MIGDSWNIRKAEGGFIVNVSKQPETADTNDSWVPPNEVERVFADSSLLLNFLHNELVGSN